MTNHCNVSQNRSQQKYFGTTAKLYENIIFGQRTGLVETKNKKQHAGYSFKTCDRHFNNDR
jgi:hypothetical protein